MGYWQQMEDKNSEGETNIVSLSEHQILTLVQSVERVLSSGVSVDDPGVNCLLRLLKAQDLSFLHSSVPTLSHNINSPLSVDQLNILKQEINAYRSLSRNIPLSPSILSQICPNTHLNTSNTLPPSLAGNKQN